MDDPKLMSMGEGDRIADFEKDLEACRYSIKLSLDSGTLRLLLRVVLGSAGLSFSINSRRVRPPTCFHRVEERPCSSRSMSWTGMMPGCSSNPVTRASLARRTSAVVEVRSDRKRFKATSRMSRSSWATTTSPMPPCPAVARPSFRRSVEAVFSANRSAAFCAPLMIGEANPVPWIPQDALDRDVHHESWKALIKVGSGSGLRYRLAL